MRHCVDAIRRYLEIENRIVGVLLDGLDRVSDVRQDFAELLIGEAAEIDVVVEPVTGKFHRQNCTRVRTLSAASCGLLRLRSTSSRIFS